LSTCKTLSCLLQLKLFAHLRKAYFSSLEKLNCLLEKGLTALLEHSREEPGLIDAQGVAVQEKLSCPYCEKAYLPSTLEKLNALLKHSREEPGLLDAPGVAVHEKLYCLLVKSLVVFIVRKLNALLEHSREEPGLLDAQGVAVQYCGERVNVDVGESVGAERLRGVLVNGLQAQRRQLRLVKQTRLQKPNAKVIH
jgi:hypothetical protein